MAGAKGAAGKWDGKRMANATTSTSTSTDTARVTKKSVPVGKPPGRPRNPVMDAVARIEASDLDQVTNWSKHAKALAIIRKVCPDVTPDEIRRRAKNWDSHFSGATISSTAVASNWARLEKAKGKPPRRDNL